MRYFLSVLLGCGMMLAAYAGLFFSALGKAPTPSATRILEWYHYKRDIAEGMSSPRIVTVAGSNGLYGISSEMIQARTGLNAVNFSTHGTITLDYLLYKAKEVLRPGDVALLALEYRFYYPKEVTSLFSEVVLGGDPAYIRSRPWDEEIHWFMSASLPVLMSHFGESPEESRRLRKEILAEVDTNLNAYGDYRGHRAESRNPGQIRAMERVEAIPQIVHWYLSMTPEIWAQIGAFAEWCRAHDVLLVATFPSVVDFPEYHESESRETAAKMVAKYAELGIPTIGKPGDFMMPRADFYDTVYHLNEDGMRKRTGKLLPELERRVKAWLDAHPSETDEN